MTRSLHTAGWLGSRSGRAPSVRTFWGLASSSTPATRCSGFTLVEMLIAMAITLVMMAAVTTLFANISNSVRNRRATIEMTNQIRHVRNVLQQDLAGATCPGLTWQRPESNHGYIEIIEGQYRDSYPSLLTDGVTPITALNPELDPALSIIPRNNNVPVIGTDNGRIDANEWEAHYQQTTSFGVRIGTSFIGTSGLGDYDDILMLTVRNENEPFVGRMPSNVRSNANNANSFDNWTSATLQSTLAEVVWFAIENPDEANNADRFFGEPGMRTIYRRTLLIAPWVNPYRVLPNGNTSDTFTDGDTFKAEPGLVRLLRDDVDFGDVADALAAIIAFQDRYDLSVRLEWDPNIGNDGRWKIMANTLGDLTKRENRFGHFGFHFQTGSGTAPARLFPYPVISTGRGYTGSTADVTFVNDPEIGGPSAAEATANITDVGAPLGGVVTSYTIDPGQQTNNSANPFAARPFAYVSLASGMSATVRPILNDAGHVVRVVHGPVPLWGSRRGEDVMLTDALAFDVRVYDPGAPKFGVREDLTDPASAIGVIVEPSDPGWTAAYLHGPDNDSGRAIGRGGTAFPLVGQGAYVDMGYQHDVNLPPPYKHWPPVFANSSAAAPWFFTPRAISDVRGNQLAPGYAVYDTWSFHYENNGRDDDKDPANMVDQGINGLDDIGNYVDPATGNIFQSTSPILGPDDVGERETAPPYDKPLRGAQVIVRAYERDSRAIRQVRVSQHFMPE